MLVLPALLASDPAMAARRHGKAPAAKETAVAPPAEPIPTPSVAIDVDSGRIIAQGTLDELRAGAGATGTLEDVFLQLTASAS